MRRTLSLVSAGLVLGMLPPVAASQEDPALSNWGQWRGPIGTGVAPKANPPVEWAEDHNVRWKVPLPGMGHSSPVIWGDRLFVTTAIPFGPKFPGKPDTAPGAHDNVRVTQRHRFAALGVRRSDGHILWQKNLHEAIPHEGGHYSGSLASASPVCDSEHVFAGFGSHGLFCLTHKGDLVWQKDLGTMQSKHAHGEGASPALSGDTIVVNWDHEGQSFIVALDKSTGDERWRKQRAEVTSWSSPIIVEHDGRRQVIVCGSDRIRGYDLADGEIIWQCGGLSKNVCATPVYADGIVLAGSSYDTRNFMAIRLEGARGDVTGTANVLWSRRQGTPYVPSPLVDRGAVYFLRHYQGVLTRLDARTGATRPGPIRLPVITDVYSSPVAAAGRVYVTDLRGTTRVLESSPQAKFLARNRLEDSFSATAALVGDELYLRGRRFLYCIAEDL